MAQELKSGPMLYYKRRLFGKNWRSVYTVLYGDSSLAWYKDKGLSDQEGGILIRDAPELIAYGQFTGMIPNQPELPEYYSMSDLLAFGTRGKDTVHWFLCRTEHDVESWMTAIASTLPPPPKPIQPNPVQQQQPLVDGPSPVPTAPATDPDKVQPPPSATDMPYNNMPPPFSHQQPPPPYYPNAAPAVIPGQYPPPPMGYRPPYTAGPLQAPYPYQQQGVAAQPSNGNTTVVVQDRRNDGGGDFAMGMLMGGAIGTTMGYGWGHGWGWGGGGAWLRPTPVIQDTDVTINNYYDVDNTVVNNSVDVNTSTDVMNYDVGGDFDGGMDFDMGDMGF